MLECSLVKGNEWECDISKKHFSFEISILVSTPEKYEISIVSSPLHFTFELEKFAL